MLRLDSEWLEVKLDLRELGGDATHRHVEDRCSHVLACQLPIRGQGLISAKTGLGRLGLIILRFSQTLYLDQT